MNDKSKRIFIFGFISLLLCGVGDWLIGYEPQGGQEFGPSSDHGRLQSDGNEYSVKIDRSRFVAPSAAVV